MLFLRSCCLVSIVSLGCYGPDNAVKLIVFSKVISTPWIVFQELPAVFCKMFSHIFHDFDLSEQDKQVRKAHCSLSFIRGWI